MNVDVQRAGDADRGALLRMRQMVYHGLTTEYHRDEIDIYLSDPSKACLVARHGKKIAPVGFIELSLRNVVDGCLTSPVGYVEGVYVEPECRGMGVGRSLLEAAIAWFKAQGCTEMATDALLDDRDAQSFHRTMGFTETYRIVQFKRDLN